MARPLKHDTGPVCVVEIDDRRIAWCDGNFFGDEELIKRALRAVVLKETFLLHRCPVQAGLFTALGAVAAMSSYAPDRSFIIECPEEVSNFLKENRLYV